MEQQQDVCSCAAACKHTQHKDHLLHACQRREETEATKAGEEQQQTQTSVTFLNDPAESSGRLERTKNVEDEATRSVSNPGSDTAQRRAVETNTHLAFLLAAMRGDPVRFGVGSAELAVGSALCRPHLSVTTDALIQSCHAALRPASFLSLCHKLLQSKLSALPLCSSHTLPVHHRPPPPSICFSSSRLMEECELFLHRPPLFISLILSAFLSCSISR